MFLQLSEPLTSQVIAPFSPQACACRLPAFTFSSYRLPFKLIRDIGITNGDEIQVGYYVGLLHSLFFATQAVTVLHWSRVSDHIGRKPVILTGLFGLSASMYCFGLSKTFWGLVMSRALNGALNGNTGVIKSIMIEITDSTNLAQAFAFAHSNAHHIVVLISVVRYRSPLIGSQTFLEIGTSSRHILISWRAPCLRRLPLLLGLLPSCS